MASDPVNGVWKAIALVLVTVLIAGSPGIIYALRTWSVANELKLVRDRQDDVRERLTAVETHLSDLQHDNDRLFAEVGLLRNELREHEQSFK